MNDFVLVARGHNATADAEVAVMREVVLAMPLHRWEREHSKRAADVSQFIPHPVHRTD